MAKNGVAPDSLRHSAGQCRLHDRKWRGFVSRSLAQRDAKLEESGVPVRSRLTISEACPPDSALSRGIGSGTREKRGEAKKIGTTGRGLVRPMKTK